MPAAPVAREVFRQVLEDDGALHGGQAPILSIDGDATDRGFTKADLRTIRDNYGPSGKVAKALGHEAMAPWRIGHEDDGALEDTFREVAKLPRTDHPALAHTKRVWIGRGPKDPTPDENGDTLWGEVERMPTAVRKLTENLYPWRSAEVERDYHGHGAHLVGVGMVGADRPAKKRMGAIVYNAERAGRTVQVHCARPLQAPVRFAEAPMPKATPVGMIVLERAKTKAAGSEQTTDEVLADLAAALKLDAASFTAALMGQGEPLTDQQLMVLANSLDMDVEELQGGGEAEEPEESDEEEQMAEKKKPAAKPPVKPPAKGDEAPGEPVTLTAEQFAELRKGADRAEGLAELLEEQKVQLAEVQKSQAATARQAAKAELEAWAQRTLFAEGRVTGEAQAKVRHALEALHPAKVEAFAQGEDALKVVQDLLVAVTHPRRLAGRPLGTGDAAPAPTGTKVEAALEAFADRVRVNPGKRAKVEVFCEVSGLSAEETAQVVAKARKDPRIGKRYCQAE